MSHFIQPTNPKDVQFTITLNREKQHIKFLFNNMETIMQLIDFNILWHFV